MERFWSYRHLPKIDLRVVLTITCLMVISLLVISSMTMESEEIFSTRYVKNQMCSFLLGWALFFFTAGINYQKLREWTWPLYLLFLLLLVGLYATSPIQNVHRWYRIPFLRMSFQPSEYAKLVLVFTLSWFIERKLPIIHTKKTFVEIMIIVTVPFLLIVKQPDLGTALVLYPIALVMSYVAGVHKKALLMIGAISVAILLLCVGIFSGFLSHREMKPLFTKVLKEYQYARLNPDTYHQRAAKTAVAIGGLTGSGYRQSLFSSQKWLPAAHTDSVFSAYAEEYGFFGVAFLFTLFYSLIYFGFSVALHAKDAYGKLLASGLTIYLTVHILLNIGMMLGLLPITGVPLLLVTYGGSSVITTMTALGLLQSIYTRRFMFA
ncbi:MAG: FtsW/RodA/SpoVE family cell cycle protein [Chlamydiota bacterium]